MTAQLLLKKEKRYAASYLKDECLRSYSPDDSDDSHSQVRFNYNVVFKVNVGIVVIF